MGGASASLPLIANPENRVPWWAICLCFFRENRFDRTHTQTERKACRFQGEYGGKKTKLSVESAECVYKLEPEASVKTHSVPSAHSSSNIHNYSIKYTLINTLMYGKNKPGAIEVLII